MDCYYVIPIPHSRMEIAMSKISSILKALFFTLIGSLLYSVALSLFFDPNHIAPGGLSGVAILIHTFLPVPTGTILFLLNVPLFFLAWRSLGKHFLVFTLVAVIFTSNFTNVFSAFAPITSDRLLASIIGGLIIAVAVAMLFHVGACTGGIDIVVKLVQKKKPHMKSGQIFLYFDLLIVLCSILVFGNVESGLYSAISVYVSSKLLDYILYGPEDAKLVYIISERNEQICDYLLHELDVGATFLTGKGAYAKHDFSILLCAMKKSSLHIAIRDIKQLDEHSFMIVSSANEIWGRGYR